MRWLEPVWYAYFGEIMKFGKTYNHASLRVPCAQPSLSPCWSKLAYLVHRYRQSSENCSVPVHPEPPSEQRNPLQLKTIFVVVQMLHCPQRHPHRSLLAAPARDDYNVHVTLREWGKICESSHIYWRVSLAVLSKSNTKHAHKTSSMRVSKNSCVCLLKGPCQLWQN